MGYQNSKYVYEEFRKLKIIILHNNNIMPYKKRMMKKTVDAKQNKAIRKLEKKLAGEVKVLDIVNGATNILNTGAIVHLNPIGQGDTANQREGNNVTMKSLTIRESYVHNVAGDFNQFYRRIVFIDKQQIADTSPATADVLQIVSYLSDYNNDTKGRFQVLSDVLTRLNNNTTNGAVRKQVKKMNTKVQFNGSASTDIQKNGLYILYIGSATANYPTYQIASRVRYIDN